MNSNGRWHASRLGRREFLKATAWSGLAALASPHFTAAAAAAAAEPLSMHTWSAAVDVVKSHLTAFERSTGIHVDYSNAPWAQYRETMVTKFAGGAPVDLLWVSDAWLPEWARSEGVV
jgi:multiple sugar transport system substrate-binding protein